MKSESVRKAREAHTNLIVRLHKNLICLLKSAHNMDQT
jgi:hypothetical protein